MNDQFFESDAGLSVSIDECHNLTQPYSSQSVVSVNTTDNDTVVDYAGNVTKVDSTAGVINTQWVTTSLTSNDVSQLYDKINELTNKINQMMEVQQQLLGKNRSYNEHDVKINSSNGKIAESSETVSSAYSNDPGLHWPSMSDHLREQFILALSQGLYSSYHQETTNDQPFGDSEDH